VPSADALVTLELITFQPWPTGETLHCLGITLSEADAASPDGRMRMKALLELPDSDDESLRMQARRQLLPVIALLRQTLPQFAIEIGQHAWVERRGVAGGTGTFGVPASAVIVNSTPLTASALAESKIMCSAWSKLRPNQQRRRRAAAYWIRESVEAPDAPQRLAAACFAIEALLVQGVAGTRTHYLEGIRALGFPLSDQTAAKTVEERVQRVLDRARSNLRGNSRIAIPGNEKTAV